MKHALIIGISGILGHALAEDLIIRGNWRVSGVSRKDTPYPLINEKANLIRCDLMKDDDVTSKFAPQVKDVTHLFFAAWIPANSEEEQCRVNLQFLRNVLETVDRNSSNLRHVYLQTGTKYYGMHVGPKKGQVSPYRESDSRLKIPNFYYDQEDFLSEYNKGKAWTFSVSRPPHITGFALHTHMNFGANLAVYAILLKEAGLPLIFPYSEKCFHRIRQFIDSRLLARFVIWQSVHTHTKNEAFNITNGDSFRLEQFWPKLAEYFGMDWSIKEGFNVKEFIRQNEGTWRRLQEKHGLEAHDLKDLGDFGFMDATFGFEWDDLSNIVKAREFGFNETLDSFQNFFDLFDELQLKKIIPEVTSKTKAPNA